jgi:hypothetical protein
MLDGLSISVASHEVCKFQSPEEPGSACYLAPGPRVKGIAQSNFPAGFCCSEFNKLCVVKTSLHGGKDGQECAKGPLMVRPPNFGAGRGNCPDPVTRHGWGLFWQSQVLHRQSEIP